MSSSLRIDENHVLCSAEYCQSPFFNERPEDTKLALIVLHNISLPPKQFGGHYISDLFLGQLDSSIHPYFSEIAHLEVSAHVLIRRDGSMIQYVPFDKRAWHAGRSSYQGRDNCNDFSIGIELEGADDIAYEKCQYLSVSELCKTLQNHYQISKCAIAGHQDIAPDRKTDPGEAFDWLYFNSLMKDA